MCKRCGYGDESLEELRVNPFDPEYIKYHASIKRNYKSPLDSAFGDGARKRFTEPIFGGKRISSGGRKDINNVLFGRRIFNPFE